MELFLDFGFAWISVFLVLLLTIIYIFRKLMGRNENLKIRFKGINRFLRKHHKKLGVALIIAAFIHGLNSSKEVFSINLGTASWILIILLGLNYMFRKSFQKIKGWMFYHRLLTISFLVVLILHIYNVGIQAPALLLNSFSNSGAGSNNNTTQNSSSTGQMAGVELKDGTYEGSAQGYGGTLTVSVVIKSNAITSIQIVSHNERNPSIYTKAMNTIPTEIINSQSIEVDTVSGATFTSVGIINAVRDALSSALISGTLPDELSLPQERGGRG